MGASVGGGKSQSRGKQAQNVLPFVRMYEQQAAPIRGEQYGQMLEALRTGGVGAQIPLIQRSVANQLRATGDTLRELRGSLTGANLAGTPFGQRAIGDILLQGRSQAANFGPQLAASLAQQVPQVSLSTIQALLGGLSAQGRQRSDAWQAEHEAHIW